MYESLSDTRKAGKCASSALSGVRIKRTNLSETTSFLSEQTKQSVISGFLIKRVSVERDSTVFINYYELDIRADLP